MDLITRNVGEYAKIYLTSKITTEMTFLCLETSFNLNKRTDQIMMIEIHLDIQWILHPSMILKSLPKAFEIFVPEVRMCWSWPTSFKYSLGRVHRYLIFLQKTLDFWIVSEQPDNPDQGSRKTESQKWWEDTMTVQVCFGKKMSLQTQTTISEKKVHFLNAHTEKCPY